MIMTVFAGIAEFERDLIRERTGAGRVEAQERGVRFGRPSKLNSEQLQLTQCLLAEGKSAREVALPFQIHPPPFTARLPCESEQQGSNGYSCEPCV